LGGSVFAHHQDFLLPRLRGAIDGKLPALTQGFALFGAGLGERVGDFAALALVDDWERWPGGRLALSGPEGAGKTHLVHVWRALSGAEAVAAADLAPEHADLLAGAGHVAVEDVDRLAGRRPKAAKDAHLHILNLLAPGVGSMMFSGRAAPTRWKIRLPDLASRLRAAPVARLEPPDDALLAAVLVKLFADRQLAVEPDLIQYLLARIDRSFAAAEEVVAALDRTGLARHRPITARLAGDVLRGEGAP
jgi:chromosomal replication initiation ATPase DnaA